MLKFKGEILSELNYLLPGYTKKKNLCLEPLNGGISCLHKWWSLSCCGNIQDLTWWDLGKPNLKSCFQEQLDQMISGAPFQIRLFCDSVA